MDVTRVSVPVGTRAPTGQTNAYLLGETDAVLVDPPAVSDTLDEAVAAREVGHVAATHHHPDHVGGLAHYARRCGATVWARAGRTDAFASATGVEPDRTLSPGTTILTDCGPVQVHDTPGHAPEHVAFVPGGELPGGGLVCGDLALAEGSVVVGAPEGDMRAYLASLRRVRAMAPATLYPGHGPTIAGTAVRETLDRLVAHRLDREERVARAVRAGAETPAEVCDRAYEKDLSGVRDLAVATVVAHLEKLAVEGRVAWDGTRARPA